MGKKFSDLERASSLNNGDLFAVAQVDAQAQTGYKSKSTETSTVAQKLLKGIEFPTDLETDDKTVLGAINEVNSRTIAFDVVSGPVANFKTSLELPIKSLGIDVNAVQSAGTPTPASPLPISGWNEIRLVHCGKNLIEIDNLINRPFWGTNEPNIVDAINKLPTGTYTISNKYKVNELPSNGKVDHGRIYITAMVNGTQVPVTTYNVTTDNSPFVGKVYQESGTFVITEENKGKINHAYLYCDQNATHSGTGRGNYDCYDIQLELGSEVTDYEPYTGTTEVINLGGTYYGGHFTQDKDGKRKLVVTHKAFVFTGSENYTAASDYFYISSSATDIETPKQKQEIASNGFTIIPMTNKSIRIYPSLGINSQYISMSSTVSELQGYLSNGIQFLYELATPYTIDLPDGEPISTLLGTNNIYADSGDASAEYALTIKDYIDKEIASVQALILNS